MKQTRILSIVWYKVLPARFGGQKGIANFNEALGKLFPLVCLCSRNNEAPDNLSYSVIPVLPVSKLQFLNPFIHQKIVTIAKKEKPTHIILEHPYHAKAALKACRATGAKLMVHSHNIESERYRQLGKRGWQLLYKHEKKVHQQADLSLFKTEDELAFAIQNFELSPGKCMVMPYGIEQPHKLNRDAARKVIADRHAIPSNSKILLFAGTLDYTPNEQAVINLVTQIAPLLSNDYKIIVCGRNRIKGFEHLNDLSHPNVILAGEVMDIDTYFAAADCFINPVMTGGGVQTKNLDALAYDLNLVCFNDMLSGIDLSLCGEKVFTASPGNWEKFADSIDKAMAALGPPPPTAVVVFYYFNRQVLKLAEHIKFTV
jgi:glycosyltransferase involved in cell wall biosynthesis